jgi:hypothetical protein
MVLVGEDTADGGTDRSGKMPRHSSRLAEKSERHTKRKYDDSDEDTVPKLKSKRKICEILSTNPKRRNSVSPKPKELRAQCSVMSISEPEETSSFKSDSNHQSDKYCHFCQV